MGEVINVGEFIKTIYFYSPSVGRSNTGSIINSYQLNGKRLAKIENKNQTEQVGGDKLNVIKIIEVTTYYKPFLNSAWQLEIGIVRYEILSIDVIDNTYMKITAKQL